jgi:GNAT superfamily N-acetyltransferase
MVMLCRNYDPPGDTLQAGEFLIKHYQPNNADGNWLEPAWEYMHFHPSLDDKSLEKIGIWEADGEIAGIAHYESVPGEAFYQLDPGYRHIQREMLDYAEKNLIGVSKISGKKFLYTYINDFDTEFNHLVQARGYSRVLENSRPIYRFEIRDQFPEIKLPNGFRLQSLAEDCDWKKVHRVLWRGFDHGEVPAYDETALEQRRKMFETPKGRLELKIVVQAPDGNFASLCGMFYEAECKYAYVEPVATDPDYRRLGLGKAAVLEGIRRCAALGAREAYVGSDQLFYQSLGFRKVYISECWFKEFD